MCGSCCSSTHLIKSCKLDISMCICSLQTLCPIATCSFMKYDLTPHFKDGLFQNESRRNNANSVMVMTRTVVIVLLAENVEREVMKENLFTKSRSRLYIFVQLVTHISLHWVHFLQNSLYGSLYQRAAQQNQSQVNLTSKIHKLKQYIHISGSTAP